MIRLRQLVVVSLLALGTGACVVHGSGQMQVETTGEVYQEPPPPQVETVTIRPGFVWIKGRWNWQNGQWVWVGGHWERERAGYAWSEGRWEHRGNRWVWVEGTWAVSSQPATVTTTVVTAPPAGGVEVRDHRTETVVTAPPAGASGGVTVTVGAYPTAAPPPVRVESPGVRAGFVWVTGRWNWINGRWDWVPGHWERERANMMWVAGRWELQGNRYVWIEGSWQARAAAPAPGVEVRDHRH